MSLKVKGSTVTVTNTLLTQYFAYGNKSMSVEVVAHVGLTLQSCSAENMSKKYEMDMYIEQILKKISIPQYVFSE
jgi:hypothetical protein